jgi:hypothetical protein
MDNQSQVKEYRLISYKLSLLMWVICCGTAIWGLYKIVLSVINRPGLWYFLFLVPFYIYVLFAVYFVVDRFRLFLSADGIRYQFWSYDIYAKWDNVERIESGFFQKRLILKNSSAEKWKYAWIISMFSPSNQPKQIPFSKFTWSKFKELENDVKKYAPHLF